MSVKKEAKLSGDLVASSNLNHIWTNLTIKIRFPLTCRNKGLPRQKKTKYQRHGAKVFNQMNRRMPFFWLPLFFLNEFAVKVHSDIGLKAEGQRTKMLKDIDRK